MRKLQKTWISSAHQGFVTDGTFGLLNVQTWMKLHKAA